MGIEEPSVKLSDVNVECKEAIEEVLKDFGDVLYGGVGRYKHGCAKIVVEEGAKPRAQKPYRIPDMLKPKVEAAVPSISSSKGI